MKILLVEDNRDLALNIIEYMEGMGHVVDYSKDGLAALDLVFRNYFDVIILDIMLPKMDGFTFCRKFRDTADNKPGVLMLTAKGMEEDVLQGFESGTDDYMIKPFSLPELEVRLQALVRRCQMRTGDGHKLVVGDLEYNPSTLRLKRAGVPLNLKPVPRKILVMLMQQAHSVVTRREIEERIWIDDPPDSEVLRSHIYTLRCELNKNNQDNILHTIRGVGYLLGDPE